MSDPAPRQFDKLVALLKELFQLDRPDLDFGVYRIMHAKSAEITKFLEQDLLPQVRDVLSQYESTDRARTLESEVYDHLYGFFRRYYFEGDFISKRVYKPGVYAIPYQGEEVKLHWANADQYYIKTSEYLRDYAFRLRPGESDPMRVRFQLVDATEGQHGNIKEIAAKKRVFVLRDQDFISEEQGEHGKELVLRFEYRPATVADWPEDQRDGKSRPPAQQDLLAEAEARLQRLPGSLFSQWRQALIQPHATADDTPAKYSCFRLHLNRYTARHTFDYFIHKDLGGFLCRELDFYIKNEVMHLDDVERDTVSGVERYLNKIRAIRCVAIKIIDFLTQLEDFQKKLWLKKKFVVETSYLIRLGYVPKKYWPYILANDSQRQEWTTLLFHDEHDRTGSADALFDDSDGSVPHPGLLVDTRHYSTRFADQLLDEFRSLDETVDGVLIHSDNWQALRLLHQKYRHNIKHVYIDPPYNTDMAAIPYKNDYKHSSWLCLLDSRLRLCARLLQDDGVLVVAIDENEQERLGLLLNQLFPEHARTCVTVVHNPGGIQGANFSYNNDFAYFIYPPKGRSIGMWNREEEPDIRPLRDVSTGQHLRTDARNCFYPILVHENKIVGFGDVCDDDFHPTAANVDCDDGTIRVYPIDAKGNERKWVFSRQTVESIKEELVPKWNSSRQIVDIIRRKTMFNYKTVWTDKRYNANSYGSKLLRDVLGEKSSLFMFPKSLHTVVDCVGAATDSRISAPQIVLDFFAGSGTTGHAVIRLNQRDGGRRKFVLVEMGDHFDTVLMPRIKKVSFTPEWRNGRPKRVATSDEMERSPRVIKVIRLESYEDVIGNLDTLQGTHVGQSTLELCGHGDSGAVACEEYLLRYMLDVESRGSASLLSASAIGDPTAYRLRVKQPGTDESREVNVDLLETFNWLIGLTVHRIAAPRTYEADTEKDEEGRLRLAGTLKEQKDGPWWFRMVTGTLPDGRSVLVIWRKRPGGESPEGIERDNLILDEWYKLQMQILKTGGGGGGF